MTETYRVGGSWKTHTIVLEGSEPADEKGRRADDLPVAWIDSAAPEGLAERVVRLLNANPPEACGWTNGYGQRCALDVGHTGYHVEGERW
jgi:hypothetical protein